MNILLWGLQIILAWLAIAGGYFQVFKLGDLQQTVASMREIPHAIWAVLGAIGCLAGLGLILPPLVKVHPEWVAYSAVVISAESVLISVLYLFYGDKAPLPYSASMAVIAG